MSHIVHSPPFMSRVAWRGRGVLASVSARALGLSVRRCRYVALVCGQCVARCCALLRGYDGPVWVDRASVRASIIPGGDQQPLHVLLLE